MRWKVINEAIEIRLHDGKPQFCSSMGFSLEEAATAVRLWTRANEDDEVESWLEAAEDEVDLARRVESRLEFAALVNSVTPGVLDLTPEEARRRAVREREFERGLRALTVRDYEKALGYLRPLAESGHQTAQFYLGLMCSKGAGMPNDDISAYVWLDLAAKGNVEGAAVARDKVAERLSAHELAAAQQSATDRSRGDAAPRKRRWRVDLTYV